MIRKSLNSFQYESPDNLKYWFDGRIRSHSGLGLEPLKFIEDFGPNQNGSTVRDWRINPRTLSLDIFLQGDYCCGTRGEQLAELINIIRPNRGTTNDVPGWFRFLNDSEQLMEIPVHVLQGPSGDFDYGGDIGKYQVLDTVQFYASDPIWREYEKKGLSVGIESAGICLESSILEVHGENNCLASDISYIKTEGDTCLSASTFFIHNLDILYDGTWDGDQIDIRILGPMTNPIITNATLNKKIELDYVLPSGNYIDVTIRPEYVTVIDNNGNNLVGTITSISDLVDFVIKSPGSITASGLNIIIISGVDSSEQSETHLEYWIRHISAYGNPQCVAPVQEIQSDASQDMIFLTESTGVITPSIVLASNFPGGNIWRVIESDGQSYIYNTPSFSHSISAVGTSQIILSKNATKYVASINISGDSLVGEVDVSPLVNCTDINFQQNKLTNLLNLTSLTVLERLVVWGNLLTVVDITGMVSLKTLDLSLNNLTDIGLVTNLVNLEYLLLNGNNLTSIGNVVNLQSLIYLYLYDNPNLIMPLELGDIAPTALSVFLLNTQCPISTASFMDCADIIQLMFNNISPPVNNVNNILESVWQSRALFNPGSHNLYLGGTNPAPSGIYQAAVVPTTGKEFAYALVNDPNGEGFPLWSVVIN